MGPGTWKGRIWRDWAAKKLGRRLFGEKYKMPILGEILGMAWPGVENVPTPRGSIFKLSRGSQLPCNKKKKRKCLLIFLYFYMK
jgi:hypothetical protein